MRERITFIHQKDNSFNPQQLQVKNDTLTITSLEAAREDQVTFSLNELPHELWRVLRQCHELHIRWISPISYNINPPFVSRLSPGVHILFTNQKNRSADLLCPILSKIFDHGIRCASPEESFVRIPLLSERFASSAASQYHHLLPSLDDLITYIQQKGCPPSSNRCKAKAETLRSVAYLDIDFDTISQILTIKTFQPSSPKRLWNEEIKAEGAKVEVGVLANEQATEPETLSLGGFLTIVGEDTKPNPTLFSFPSRHHSSDTTYLTHFLHPTGLHPTLRLTFPAPPSPPSRSCALHAYLTLPSSLFPDRYQLSSPLLLASKNLHSIRAIYGETDLEAPDWAVKKWGSVMLLQLANPSSLSNTETDRSWHADIPLHLRYLLPTPGGMAEAQVPWPVVFWACRAEEGTKMTVNPFDRVNLGYDGLFGPRTMFYHLQPDNSGGSLVEAVKVPVLDTDRAGGVKRGTVGVVVLGTLWVLWVLGRVVWKDWHVGRVKGESGKTKKKQ